MALRSWFRRQRDSALQHPVDPNDSPVGTEPPLLPDGEVGHVVLTWKHEDEFEEDDGIGPWVERYADSDAAEPVSAVTWNEWLPYSEAREYARSHGYEFNEG